MSGHQSPLTRCFIGLPMPPSLEQRLQQRCLSIKQRLAMADLRWVPLANWHATLHFLGNLNTEQIALVIEAMQAVSVQWPEHTGDQSEPVELSVREIGYFPSLKKPIAIAADLHAAPGLLRLQQLLGEALQAAGFKIETRRYRPHITLARINRARIKQGNSIQPLRQGERQWSANSLAEPASEMCLYRSDQVAGGVRYTSLQQVCLVSD